MILRVDVGGVTPPGVLTGIISTGLTSDRPRLHLLFNVLNK